MKAYYKARKVDYKPYIIFDKIAHDDNDLDYLVDEYGEDRRLAIPEDKLPKMRYGICEKDLDENGQLVNRPQKDFDDAREAHIESKVVEVIKEIDSVTSSKIKTGFEFDGYMFSLSSNAQLNWQNILNEFNLGEFQSAIISTKDDKIYTLSKNKVEEFYKVYINTLNSILNEGRERKKNARSEALKNLKEIEDYDI